MHAAMSLGTAVLDDFQVNSRDYAVVFAVLMHTGYRQYFGFLHKNPSPTLPMPVLALCTITTGDPTDSLPWRPSTGDCCRCA
eukprot:m.303281 g.303281  ORF g.303281 m.303281 type:complete len:82 (+) comp20162_c0_seq4:219-464(+)